MRLLFIRHAEPDYRNDSLTEKGWREAELLAERAPALGIDEAFVSPLGRAKRTAECSLRKIGLQGTEMSWLEEFDAPVDLNETPWLLPAYPNMKEETDNLRPATGEAGERTGLTKAGRYPLRRPWDIAPAYYAAHPDLADPVRWRESEIYRCSRMPERYDEVVRAFRALLAEHDYVYENGVYRVKRENRKTLAFFCHLGITCVLLSALWDVSPFFLWHTMFLPPSSVTEAASEEREQGIALFRAQRIGDCSHLYAGGEPVSFSGRFCEVYSDFSKETGRH